MSLSFVSSHHLLLAVVLDRLSREACQLWSVGNGLGLRTVTGLLGTWWVSEELSYRRIGVRNVVTIQEVEMVLMSYCAWSYRWE